MTASMRICKSRTINGSFSDPAAIRDPCAPLKRPRGNRQPPPGLFTGRPRREKGRTHERSAFSHLSGKLENFEQPHHPMPVPPQVRTSAPRDRTPTAPPTQASASAPFFSSFFTPSALPCTINQGSRGKKLGPGQRAGRFGLRSPGCAGRRQRSAPCPARLPFGEHFAHFEGCGATVVFSFFAVQPSSRAPGGLPRERTCCGDRQR
jgi:hypothetical protein